VSEKILSYEDSAKTGWAFWQAAMKGQTYPTNPAYVPIGFFRHYDRHKTKSWPVSIWIASDGVKRIQVGDADVVVCHSREVEEDFAYKTFQYCCKNAISYETYKAWKATREWPPEIADDKPVERDSNSPPDTQVKESITELRAEAEKWLKDIGGTVTTQEQADKAADYSSRFSDLEKEAKEARESGRKPHLERAAEVQTIWKPIEDAGAAAKTWAKNLTADFQKAERARVLKEAAERAAAGEAVSVGNLRVKTGTRGRAVTLRSRIEYRCDDVMKIFAHYRDDPRFAKHLLVVQALGQMAKADLEAGGTVPGARLEVIENVA
jgi:hypothetical protein